MKENKIIGYCQWCGDEVYEGDMVYESDKIMVHEECFLEYLENALGIEGIARLCGYEGKIGA